MASLVIRTRKPKEARGCGVVTLATTSQVVEVCRLASVAAKPTYKFSTNRERPSQYMDFGRFQMHNFDTMLIFSIW